MYFGYWESNHPSCLPLTRESIGGHIRDGTGDIIVARSGGDLVRFGSLREWVPLGIHSLVGDIILSWTRVGIVNLAILRSLQYLPSLSWRAANRWLVLLILPWTWDLTLESLIPWILWERVCTRTLLHHLARPQIVLPWTRHIVTWASLIALWVYLSSLLLKCTRTQLILPWSWHLALQSFTPWLIPYLETYSFWSHTTVSLG
jgi:hypothetical protein